MPWRLFGLLRLGDLRGLGFLPTGFDRPVASFNLANSAWETFPSLLASSLKRAVSWPLCRPCLPCLFLSTGCRCDWGNEEPDCHTHTLMPIMCLRNEAALREHGRPSRPVMHPTQIPVISTDIFRPLFRRQSADRVAEVGYRLKNVLRRESVYGRRHSVIVTEASFPERNLNAPIVPNHVRSAPLPVRQRRAARYG